jgi:phosphoenolpyruvate carboxylase
LTAHLANDPQYGEIWTRIRDEYERTCRYMFRLTGQSTLMGGHPVDQLSIEMRERIVLPLVTIQQYAIGRVNELEQSDSLPELKSSLEKLAMRCSFGIINAGRNSA